MATTTSRDQTITMDSVVGKTFALLGGTVCLSVGTYAAYRYITKGEEVVDSDIKERKENKVLVIGLDGSGKTSILTCLRKQKLKESPQPTEGFNVWCIQTNDVSLTIWEIGGAKNMRPYWSNFVQYIGVLVFVVDSSKPERLKEAVEEYNNLLSLAAKALKNVPIIIIANKQDCSSEGNSNILKPDEIEKALTCGAQRWPRVKCLPAAVPLDGEAKGLEEVEKLMVNYTTGKP